MNKLEKWFLKRILKKEVRKGYSHTLRIENLYKIIRDIVANEFIEETNDSLDRYCLDCFKKSQKVNDPTPTEFLYIVKEDGYRTDQERIAAKILLTMLAKEPDKIASNGKYY